MEATRPDQETEPKSKKRFLVVALLLIVVAAALWFFLSAPATKVEAPPPPANALPDTTDHIAPDTVTTDTTHARLIATDTIVLVATPIEPGPAVQTDTLYLQSAQGFAYTYIGEVKNGKANGTGKAVFDNGNIYTGNFRNNQRSGYGKAVNANGESYEGQWKNDRFEGKGTYTWKNGDRFVGHFKAAKRNGQGTLYNKKGLKIKEGNWKDDELVK